MDPTLRVTWSADGLVRVELDVTTARALANELSSLEGTAERLAADLGGLLQARERESEGA